jgi:hypothetical protein
MWLKRIKTMAEQDFIKAGFTVGRCENCILNGNAFCKYI